MKIEKDDDSFHLSLALLSETWYFDILRKWESKRESREPKEKALKRMTDQKQTKAKFICWNTEKK